MWKRTQQGSGCRTARPWARHSKQSVVHLAADSIVILSAVLSWEHSALCVLPSRYDICWLLLFSLPLRSIGLPSLLPPVLISLGYLTNSVDEQGSVNDMYWLLSILKDGKCKIKSQMFLLLPCSSSRAFSKCVIHPFLSLGPSSCCYLSNRLFPICLGVISPERAFMDQSTNSYLLCLQSPESTCRL